MAATTMRRITSTSGNGMNAIAAAALLLVSLFSVTVVHARPNFIFMYADDLGFGDLKSYGHPYAITDNVDRLAREGTAFYGFHNTGNICPTSRAGFMTSRNPSWFPNYTPDFGFRGTMTVTQLLQDAGYQVGHIGKWNIGDPTPARSDTGFAFPEYGMTDVRITHDGRNDPRGKEAHRYDLAIDFVEQNQNVPFYLNVWQYVPHSPILPAAILKEKFNGLVVNRSLFGPYMQQNFDTIERLGGNIDVSMQNYLAEVYGMDIHIGRLLTRLDELGLANTTLLVFSSDNGPAVNDQPDDYAAGWSGGLRGGKHNWYEGGPSVPFIVRWPGRVPAGKVNTESFFSSLDWLPTICSLAGANYSQDLVEGEDVSDIWLGSNRSRKNPTFYQDPFSDKVAVRYDKWKMLQWKNELYEIDVDRQETSNVYNDYPEIVAAMTDLIDQYKVTIPQNHAFEGQSPLPFDPMEPVQTYEIPTVLATPAPTPSPSLSPSMYVSSNTTMSPSMFVFLNTSFPTSNLPSTSPSFVPTVSPSARPSIVPTTFPSARPSHDPTIRPSNNPTIRPSNNPTISLSFSPSVSPSSIPTMEPTFLPTSSPTSTGFRYFTQWSCYALLPIAILLYIF